MQNLDTSSVVFDPALHEKMLRYIAVLEHSVVNRMAKNQVWYFANKYGTQNESYHTFCKRALYKPNGFKY